MSEFVFAQDYAGTRYHILPNPNADVAWCGVRTYELIVSDYREADAWLTEHPYDLCIGCASAEIF